MLKSAKTCYQKIEELALAVIVTPRKLQPYFLGHKIFVKTNYRVQQIMKKLALAYFLVEFSSPVDKDFLIVNTIGRWCLKCEG